MIDQSANNWIILDIAQMCDAHDNLMNVVSRPTDERNKLENFDELNQEQIVGDIDVQRTNVIVPWYRLQLVSHTLVLVQYGADC